MATVGDDIVLPCRLDPATDATGLTLEWRRPDLDPHFVFVWRLREEMKGVEHSYYTNRATLFTDELKNGNISLKLPKVKVSDDGTYLCYIPLLRKQTSVKLNVGK